jgi:hypothetical protein
MGGGIVNVETALTQGFSRSNTPEQPSHNLLKTRKLDCKVQSRDGQEDSGPKCPLQLASGRVLPQLGLEDLARGIAWQRGDHLHPSGELVIGKLLPDEE